MYAHTLQCPRPALPVFIHPQELAALSRTVRAAARTGARLAAMAGFACAMWLLLAGPGLLDARSSTVDHAHTPLRQAAR